MAGITITRADFVAVPSTDRERSRAFYADTPGLPPDEGTHRPSPGFHDPDGTTLMLHRRYAPRES